jgi:phospholipid/cholesterol/gamma-HCH transport system substrate-binding protein
MENRGFSIGRILVMVAFALSCFGLLLFLWLTFGGSVPLEAKGYRFHIRFPEATTLAKQADVRISGVPVGKVVDIQPDAKSGLSNATVELQRRYAPIPNDARAILRQKTLLGETYVELTPGTRGPAHRLKDGGYLPQGNVAPTVQLDEIQRALDPKTRVAFQHWMQQQAAAFAGRGQDLNDVLGNLAPFSEDTNRLLTVLNSQEGAVRRLISNTGVVFNALSARDAQLRSLIQNSNTVFATTARRNDDLAAAIRALPTFEQESTTTLARLERFASNTNPLITQLRPAARQLSPTLVDLARLSPDLKGLFQDLNPLIDTGKRGLPALKTFLDAARPFLGALEPDIRNIQPIVSFLGNYNKEIAAFFANTVGATEAYDQPVHAKGPVHYLRTANPVNAENLAAYPRRLGSNRSNAYPAPGQEWANVYNGVRTYLPVFDDRNCSNKNPGPPVGDLLSQLVSQVFFTATGGLPAPPCVQATPYLGNTTRYPHVTLAPPTR